MTSLRKYHYFIASVMRKYRRVLPADMSAITGIFHMAKSCLISMLITDEENTNEKTNIANFLFLYIF